MCSADVRMSPSRRLVGRIHERNHLRLWLAPVKFRGKLVWVGQISRDIGVRFTRKTIVTHKIDPDVDETRGFLVQDLWYSQGLGTVRPNGRRRCSPHINAAYQFDGRSLFHRWATGRIVGLQRSSSIRECSVYKVGTTHSLAEVSVQDLRIPADTLP
jgi:hypothetical protein